MTEPELYRAYLDCPGKLTTDSRKVSSGDMFVALKGENFDGNDYALKALEDGASYAVVNRERFENQDNPKLLKVDDTLHALWSIAREHRRAVLEGKPVIALTGTNGKTTTKELIRCVLAAKYRVCATSGNLNNNIGVPLTLLGMDSETEIAVVEMGASHPGDIEELVRIALPNYGLITNVGRAHLLGFGSFEGVKATKGEMYDFIRAEGYQVFVDVDNQDLCEMAYSREMDFVPYGKDFQEAVVLESDADNPFLRMDVPSIDGMMHIRTSLVGSYNASNVLCAICVGRYFGVEDTLIEQAINSYKPSNNRSQMVRTSRNTLVVDAYNANPTSMSAALDNFAAMKAPFKMVLLGAMRELGEESRKEHRAILEKVLSCGFGRVCLVGEEFAEIGLEGAEYYPTSAALAENLRQNPVSGACILIKGSRGIRMETVLDVL